VRPGPQSSARQLPRSGLGVWRSFGRWLTRGRWDWSASLRRCRRVVCWTSTSASDTALIGRCRSASGCFRCYRASGEGGDSGTRRTRGHEGAAPRHPPVRSPEEDVGAWRGSMLVVVVRGEARSLVCSTSQCRRPLRGPLGDDGTRRAGHLSAESVEASVGRPSRRRAGWPGHRAPQRAVSRAIGGSAWTTGPGSEAAYPSPSRRARRNPSCPRRRSHDAWRWFGSSVESTVELVH
jgi:hypothetical protein